MERDTLNFRAGNPFAAVTRPPRRYYAIESGVVHDFDSGKERDAWVRQDPRRARIDTNSKEARRYKKSKGVD